jgi:predicted dehydrogenase
MAAPIGVALIGAGWAGERHAQAYRTLREQVRIVAVADTRPVVAETCSHEWQIPFATGVWAEAIAQPEVDAVDICLPHTLHAEVAQAALAARKHVLVEKPYATSISEADTMIAAAARAGRICMVAENVRYDAVYRRMAARIAAGAIGTPFLCRVFRDHNMHDDLRLRPWFFTDPTGGIMWSGGIHDIETVRMLMGDMPIVDVYATAARKTLHEMETDDTSVGIFRLEGGGVAFLSESFSTHAPDGARIRAEVFGPDGSLLADGGDTLTFVRPGGATTTEQIETEETFRAEIRHFLDCINTGIEPDTTVRRMRPGVAAILAAQASMALGVPVTPEP